MKIRKKLLSVTLALATVFTMSGIAAIPQHASASEAASPVAAPAPVQYDVPESVTVPADEVVDEPAYMGASEREISEELAAEKEAEKNSPIRFFSFGAKGSTGSPRSLTAPQAHGIDVSQYQHDSSKDAAGNKTYYSLDWHAIKASGIDFAIIRIGGRKISTGQIYMDPCYEMNIRGALSAGVAVGLYFYTGATTPEEAREEARWILSKSAGYSLSMPIFMDYEYQSQAAFEVDRLRDFGGSYANRTSTIAAFCATIESAGRRGGIYTGAKIANNDIDWTAISNLYMTWVARYGLNDGTANMDYFPNAKNVDIWQYSSNGYVNGIPKRVDLDLWYNSGNLNVSSTTVRRVYNPWTGEHLFTSSFGEFTNLLSSGWRYESGGGWQVPEYSAEPVMRLVYRETGEHLLVSDPKEIHDLLENGWIWEGRAFYADEDHENGYPVYRLFNPAAAGFNHMYTTDLTGKATLEAMGWKLEGIAFWGTAKEFAVPVASLDDELDSVTDPDGLIPAEEGTETQVAEAHEETDSASDAKAEETAGLVHTDSKTYRG